MESIDEKQHHEDAIPWIKIQRTLLGHRKIRYLIGDVKKIDPDFGLRDAWGSLILLWIQAAQQYPSGEIRDCRNVEEEIAQMCDWHGDPRQWVEILCANRWLDKTEHGYKIHHWEHHTENWWSFQAFREKRREQNRVAARNYRKKIKEDAEQYRVIRDQMGPPYDAKPLRKPISKPSANVSDDALMTPADSAMTHSLRHNGPKKWVENMAEKQQVSLPPSPDESTAESSTFAVIADSSSKPAESARLGEERIGVIKRQQIAEIQTTNVPPTMAGSVELLQALFQQEFGEPIAQRLKGHWIKIFARFNKQGHLFPEIQRRTNNWFGSGVAKEKYNFQPSAFEKCFTDLRAGPLVRWEKSVTQARRNDGGFDQPTGTEEYKPDF